MINLVWSGLLALLLLSGCGWNGTPSRVNDFVPLTSIVISADSSTIAKGTSTKLIATGNFTGLFTRDISDQVIWSSNSPTTADFKFATTPNKNRVTAGNAAGTAILTATLNGVSADFTLTVSNAALQSIAITPLDPSTVKGLTTQFSANGTFLDGTTQTTQDLTFDATWASSDPTVATVSDAVANKGFAQALKAGTTTISATFPFNGVSNSSLLTVTNPVLESITVTPDNASVLTLSTSTFSYQATGHYNNGTTADLTSQVVWASSVPASATIAATGGAATGLTKGTTSISATLGSISGATNLNVTGGNLTGFFFSTANPATPTKLVKGTVARIAVIGTFDNGSSRDITGAVAWTPDNSALATVTVAGGNLAWLNAVDVTPALSPTVISATVGSITKTTNLTVTSPTLQSVVTVPTGFGGLVAGTSTRFIATAAFNDGWSQDVTFSATWTSNNNAVATVGDSGINKGRVRGVAAGSTTISAAYGGKTFITDSVTVQTTTFQNLILSVDSTVSAGKQAKYTATANGVDVTEDTVWSIDNPSVAVLADSTNQPGQVVGVNSGTTILRATFGGFPNPVTTSVIVQ